jgi:hypothetical protein
MRHLRLSAQLSSCHLVHIVQPSFSSKVSQLGFGLIEAGLAAILASSVMIGAVMQQRNQARDLQALSLSQQLAVLNDAVVCHLNDNATSAAYTGKTDVGSSPPPDYFNNQGYYDVELTPSNLRKKGSLDGPDANGTSCLSANFQLNNPILGDYKIRIFKENGQLVGYVIPSQRPANGNTADITLIAKLANNLGSSKATFSRTETPNQIQFGGESTFRTSPLNQAGQHQAGQLVTKVSVADTGACSNCLVVDRSRLTQYMRGDLTLGNTATNAESAAQPQINFVNSSGTATIKQNGANLDVAPPSAGRLRTSGAISVFENATRLAMGWPFGTIEQIGNKMRLSGWADSVVLNGLELGAGNGAGGTIAFPVNFQYGDVTFAKQAGLDTTVRSLNQDLRLQSQSGYNTIINATSGNVGIGTSTPTTKLQVNGTFSVQGQAWLQAPTVGYQEAMLTIGAYPSLTGQGSNATHFGYNTSNVVGSPVYNNYLRGNGSTIIDTPNNQFNGRVGIGSAPSVTSKLTLANNVATILQTDRTASSADLTNQIVLYEDGSDRYGFGISAYHLNINAGNASPSHAIRLWANANEIASFSDGNNINFYRSLNANANSITGVSSYGINNSVAGMMGDSTNVNNLRLTHQNAGAVYVRNVDGTLGNIQSATVTATTGTFTNLNVNGATNFINDIAVNGVLIGKGASSNGTSNSDSTRIGNNALVSNTTGFRNTAIGFVALSSNTTGNYNTATGYYALSSNTTGSANVANGVNALRTNTIGTSNIAIGLNPLYSNQNGSGNVAVGYQALYSSTGSNNLANGYQAGYNLTSGNNNIALGANTNFASATGSNQLNIGNTITGTNIGLSNAAISVAGSLAVTNDIVLNGISIGRCAGNIATNTCLGNGALASNTTGSYNAAVGASALFANSTGAYNNAIGYQSLFNNTTGWRNTAIGYQALYNNTTANDNLAIGYQAAASNITGVNLIAIGNGALYSMQSGGNVVAIGNGALQLNTASNVVAIGSSALTANTTGTHNTALGTYALVANTTGSANVGVGVALSGNTTGSNNVAVGINAIGGGTGSDNTALGSNIMNVLSSGYENIGIGTQALSNVTTGFRNIAIGRDTLSSIVTGSNNISIGYGANVSEGSNQLNIGNSIYGVNIGQSNLSIGIGTSAPQAKLEITGDINNSQLALRATSAAGYSVSSVGGMIFHAYNAYYVNNAWQRVSNGSNNQAIMGSDGTGMNWWAGNTATSGNWNVANNVPLWNQAGAWSGSIDTTFRVNVSTNGGYKDSYGSVTVANPANGNAYSYYSMVRQGNVAMGMGINTSNQFIIGGQGVGSASTGVIDGTKFTLDMGTGNLTLPGNQIALGASTILTDTDGGGAGARFLKAGNDIELWDCNIANTLCLYGQQNAQMGSIKLGNLDGNLIYADATNMAIRHRPGGTLFIQGGSAGGSVGSLYSDYITAQSYNTASDIRLKQNVMDIGNVGNIIDAIQVKQYQYINNPYQQRYGVIAQQLQMVLPNLVEMNPTTGFLAVNYGDLIPVAIRELQDVRQRLNTNELITAKLRGDKNSLSTVDLAQINLNALQVSMKNNVNVGGNLNVAGAIVTKTLTAQGSIALNSTNQNSAQAGLSCDGQDRQMTTSQVGEPLYCAAGRWYKIGLSL